MLKGNLKYVKIIVLAFLVMYVGTMNNISFQTDSITISYGVDNGEIEGIVNLEDEKAVKELISICKKGKVDKSVKDKFSDLRYRKFINFNNGVIVAINDDSDIGHIYTKGGIDAKFQCEGLSNFVNKILLDNNSSNS